MPHLAIFDLDETLIDGDSDYLWGEFVCEKGIVDKNTYQIKNLKFYQDYQAGKLDINTYLQFIITPLTKIKYGQLMDLHQEFMQTKIIPIVRPAATKIIAKHCEKEDVLLIITSTINFITAPIAKYLKIDNLLAPEAELIGDFFSGKIMGVPTFREGKVIRIKQWIQECAKTGKNYSLSNASFYTDSINDRFLLEAVEKKIVVNPSIQLKKLAEKNNWKILKL